MRTQVLPAHGVRPLSRSARLAALQHDLGIEDHQQVEWDSFVDTCDLIAQWLRDDEKEANRLVSASAPCATTAMHNTSRRLAAKLAALKLLRGSTSDLYEALNSRQQVRADRLLPALCREIGLDLR